MCFNPIQNQKILIINITVEIPASKTSSVDTCRAVTNFTFELLGTEGAIDGCTVGIENRVRAGLSCPSRPSSRARKHKENSRNEAKSKRKSKLHGHQQEGHPHKSQQHGRAAPQTLRPEAFVLLGLRLPRLLLVCQWHVAAAGEKRCCHWSWCRSLWWKHWLNREKDKNLMS